MESIIPLYFFQKILYPDLRTHSCEVKIILLWVEFKENEKLTIASHSSPHLTPECLLVGWSRRTGLADAFVLVCLSDTIYRTFSNICLRLSHRICICKYNYQIFKLQLSDFPKCIYQIL